MCRGKLWGKQIFRGKLYLFIIFGIRKKLFETSRQNSRKNCVHLFRGVSWNVIVDLFWRIFVSVSYFGTCPTKFQNPEKNFQTAFPKVYSTFPEERFQDKRRFFQRNCEVSSILDSETKLFEKFVSTLRQSGHNRILPVELNVLIESSIFLKSLSFIEYCSLSLSEKSWKVS